MKKWFYRLLGLALLAAAGWGAFRFFNSLPSRQVQIPVTKVRRGDVVVRSFTRGELRAVRSATLSAPNLFGTVQVTRIAPLGSFAREKDLIVEFDDSEVQSRLDSKLLDLESTDEQIKKSQADLSIRNNQDQVDLLRARYAVRRAELEVKRNELLSTIDQKRNALNLEEARRRLKQLESDIKSKQEQAQAELAVLRERRNRAVLDINREKMRLAQVKLLSPISGLVAIKQNRSGFSGMFGTQVPDIREGDQVQPGTAVADVLDLSELEVIARVGELDRANLREGQEVLIRLDAIADKTFNGAIKSMSGTASANIFSSDPGKKFDVIFSIDMKQLLTTLGAKPDQIARILATAAANRKKPIATAPSSMFAGMAGAIPNGMAGGIPGGGNAMQAGGSPGGMIAMQGGGQAAVGGAPGTGATARGGEGGGRVRTGGGAGGGMFGNLTDDQRLKMREIMQKELNGRSMQDLSQEERQKVLASVQAQMAKITGAPGAAGAKPAEGTKTAAASGAGQAAGPAGGMFQRGSSAAMGGPGGSPGASGRGGTAGGGQGQGGAGGGMPFMFGGGQQYTAAQLENAKLPAPPGEDTNLDVLLRPGLLADVEITVEKVQNAIYVPNQSVFEKDGTSIVYLKTGSKFEARPIKIAKRSETVSVISEGLTGGETISMSDPTVKPGDKKNADKKQGGNPMGALPGGGQTKGGQ